VFLTSPSTLSVLLSLMTGRIEVGPVVKSVVKSVVKNARLPATLSVLLSLMTGRIEVGPAGRYTPSLTRL
jgi:hypothetical protein